MKCCCRCLYWTYRALFCCSRLFINPRIDTRKKYNSIHPSKAPWLWIGAEMANGKIVTVTDKVNSYIEYDDIVDTKYLQTVTDIKDGVSRWIYLDSKTLNEQEFPPEGLIIKNDSIESASS